MHSCIIVQYAKRTDARGFTLPELMVVAAIIAIIAALAIPFYAYVEQRAHIAKASADTRSMATAVSMYQAHVGTLPATLDDLVASTRNAQGVPAGPVLDSVPKPPPTWGERYTYAVNQAAGTFVISASGDGTTITRP